MDSNLSVDKLKSKGNKFFSQGKYLEAIQFYSEAIELDPKNAILYSNRAFAYIKIEKYFHAGKDCDKAIELDGLFDKAYFRRAIVRKELKRFKSALEDLRKALQISPNNGDIKKEIQSLSEILRTKKPIRIYPIVKDVETRSELPLKQLIISNENDVVMEEESRPISHENLMKRISTQNPNNFVEFDRFWRQLSDSSLKMYYLEKIDISAFRKIFEYPFEPNLLFDVIKALSQSEKHSFIFRVLEAMTQMPRFELNFLFTSKQEDEILQNIFAKLLDSNQILKADLQALARKFNVQMLS